jgi:hypothetical protein
MYIRACMLLCVNVDARLCACALSCLQVRVDEHIDVRVDEYVCVLLWMRVWMNICILVGLHAWITYVYMCSLCR